MGKPTRKVPQSVKVQRRIDEAVQAAIAGKDQQILNQAKRHQKRVEELTADLEASTAQFAWSTWTAQPYSGWIVQNWRKGWLWLSNWIFILIAWVAYNGIPNELLVLIPEANRTHVIPILSAIGVICRFIDQSRKKPLPEVTAEMEA